MSSILHPTNDDLRSQAPMEKKGANKKQREAGRNRGRKLSQEKAFEGGGGRRLFLKVTISFSLALHLRFLLQHPHSLSSLGLKVREQGG